MYVNPNLLVIPEKEFVILYSPLQGNVIQVTNSVVSQLQEIERGQTGSLDPDIKQRLKKSKVISEEEFPPIPQDLWANHTYKPRSVTLMPTWDCNLRCGYCYSYGGENIGKVMGFEIARTAIDTIVENAGDKSSLGFHGGGEPFHPRAFELVQHSVNYFRRKTKEKGVKGRVMSATNAVITEAQLGWIVDHFDYLTISFDGFKDIQNSQRPTKKGGNSYDAVIKTINRLNKARFKFGIRATITKESVSDMPRILEFFHEVAPNCSSFHLEPLFECGRCSSTGAKAPSPEDFLKYAIETRKRARELGVEFAYSGSQLENIQEVFCGAAGRNFFVTPQGNVTTCLEVSREEDPRSKYFFVGRCNPEIGRIKLFEDKIDYLKTRTIGRMEGCQDCYAKFNCAGDCLAKAITSSGDMFDSTQNPRCIVNKGLLLDEIRTKLKI